MKILTAIILFTNMSLACDYPKYVDSGTTVACEGFIFSPDQELKLRTDLETNKAMIKLLNERNDLDKQLIADYEKHIKLYRDAYYEEKRTDFWANTLYFLAGATLTAVVARAVR